MTYIVPPKKIVSFKGQTYGAGDRVPGYEPVREVKQEVKPSKGKVKPFTNTVADGLTEEVHHGRIS